MSEDGISCPSLAVIYTPVRKLGAHVHVEDEAMVVVRHSLEFAHAGRIFDRVLSGSMTLCAVIVSFKWFSAHDDAGGLSLEYAYHYDLGEAEHCAGTRVVIRELLETSLVVSPPQSLHRLRVCDIHGGHRCTSKTTRWTVLEALHLSTPFCWPIAPQATKRTCCTDMDHRYHHSRRLALKAASHWTA